MSDFMISSPAGQNPVGPIHRVSPYNNPGLSSREVSVKPEGATVRGDDTVELSEHAQWMDRLRQLPEVRGEKVTQVRQAIANALAVRAATPATSRPRLKRVASIRAPIGV